MNDTTGTKRTSVAAAEPVVDPRGGRLNTRKWAAQDVSLDENARSKHRSCDISGPDLRAVADSWPTLPGAVRAGIVAMVRAASGEHEQRGTS